MVKAGSQQAPPEQIKVRNRKLIILNINGALLTMGSVCQPIYSHSLLTQYRLQSVFDVLLNVNVKKDLQVIGKQKAVHALKHKIKI